MSGAGETLRRLQRAGAPGDQHHTRHHAIDARAVRQRDRGGMGRRHDRPEGNPGTRPALPTEAPGPQELRPALL